MADERGLPEVLAEHLAGATALLTEALATPESLRLLMSELGWQIPDAVTAVGLDAARVDEVMTAFEDVMSLDVGDPDDSTRGPKYVALVAAVARLAANVNDLGRRVRDYLDAAFVAASQIATEL